MERSESRQPRDEIEAFRAEQLRLRSFLFGDLDEIAGGSAERMNAEITAPCTGEVPEAPEVSAEPIDSLGNILETHQPQDAESLRVVTGVDSSIDPTETTFGRDLTRAGMTELFQDADNRYYYRRRPPTS